MVNSYGDLNICVSFHCFIFKCFILRFSLVSPMSVLLTLWWWDVIGLGLLVRFYIIYLTHVSALFQYRHTVDLCGSGCLSVAYNNNNVIDKLRTFDFICWNHIGYSDVWAPVTESLCGNTVDLYCLCQRFCNLHPDIPHTVRWRQGALSNEQHIV